MKKTAKQIVRASDKAAQNFASALGGRKTRASGSGLEKGDGRVKGRFRIETKCPPTAKYRVEMKEWNKVHLAAIEGGEVALMHLKLLEVELIVMRLQDFLGFDGLLGDGVLDLGLQKGHTISKKLWMEAVVIYPQLRFSLTDGSESPVERHFIVLPRHDFIKMAGPL